MGTPHSSKLQHYWHFSIRFFTVISRYCLVEFNSSAEMQSVHSAVPAAWINLLGESYPSFKDAVGVCCSPNRLSQLVEGVLSLLQRISQCILQPQPTGPTRWRESYPSAEIQSVYSAAPSDRVCATGLNAQSLRSALHNSQKVILSPTHPGMPALVLLLCTFAASPYYVIDYFMSLLYTSLFPQGSARDSYAYRPRSFYRHFESSLHWYSNIYVSIYFLSFLFHVQPFCVCVCFTFLLSNSFLASTKIVT